MITVAQDPSSHLPYEVDWSAWLAAREYNIADIQSIEWIVPADKVEITYSRTIGAKSTVWLRNISLNVKAKITCRIKVTAPTAVIDPVQDDYSFTLLGSPT